MGLFDIPKRPDKSNDLKVAKKSNRKANKSSSTVRVGNSTLQVISNIKAMVEKNLGYLRDKYTVISDIDTLHNYISACIDNNVISIDTETTGLDPMLDKIVGICIYTPNQKPAYVPVNHISYVTGARCSNQLTEKECKAEFDRIAEAKIDIIMFNAKFDIRVMRNQIGVYLTCTWDCLLGARLLNENEPTNRLKELHKKYVMGGKGDAFSFDALFKGITFDKVPIDVGYLYAAHDAEITYELYDFQKPYLTADNEICINSSLQDVAWVFKNIEMPCIESCCDMEDNGIEFDFEVQKKLSEKYNKLLTEKQALCYTLLENYQDDIDKYIVKHPNCKLSNPINLSSPAQLAVLIYDVMQIEPVDKKSPRGTGEDILKKIGTKFCLALVEYKKVSKLVSAFVDSLSDYVNPNDGRIHCNLNQYGADTGRMSCSNPNLQQIPSHTKDIRHMFKATGGYVLMSSDFSQQEPKTLAAMCAKAGDSQLLDTFLAGKDLYSEIASKSFNVPYEDCREFRLDGTVNPEGKERRTQAKSILLGILYGRGEKSIADQLKVSEKKAHEIKSSVFKAFPAISKFEQDSKDMAYELGYVTTVCGRKRRLPDYSLPEYEFNYINGVAPDDDLLDFDDEEELITEVPENIQDLYLRQLNRAYSYKAKQTIIDKAKENGITITCNSLKIADAERQCVNARIQGGAADLTKLALIDLTHNEELKSLGFRLLIPVHDEVIAECPEENAKVCAELLAKTMSEAAEKILKMPIKCDVEVTKCWYEGSG